MPARVGFLGLGIMGSPMAQNLIKAGCDVTVWNRTESKCSPLISLGANAWMSLVEGMELQKRWVLEKADEMPARVGFLGLGIMCLPMAQNLIKAGCDVTVWNRTESKCSPLILLGAKYKSSPKEVAASCDVTLPCLLILKAHWMSLVESMELQKG